MTVNINAGNSSSIRLVEQSSVSAPSGSAARVYVNNAARRRLCIVDSAGVTTFIGNTSGSGTGITFPATQDASTDANTLDDYEEGTWTPVIRGSGTAGTYETATAIGTYTKIGNRIHLFCRVTLAAVVTGGGTGYLQITGLPVGTTNAENAIGSTAATGLDMTANYTWLSASPESGSGSVVWYLRQSGDNQAMTEFPISGIGANDSFEFNATYRA